MSSAQRAGLEAVPCTSTTGIRPVLCGCSMNILPQICVADREVAGAKTSDLEIPNRRPFQTQGEGRIVSYSMGTSTPSILSDLPESGV